MQTVRRATEESRLEGNIGFSAYVKYFQAGASLFLLLATFLLSVTAEVCITQAGGVYGHSGTLGMINYLLLLTQHK